MAMELTSERYLEGLNPAQRQAVTMPAHAAVQVMAGAGTGKTELISRRFVKLVKGLRAQGIEDAANRILVVTFTEDAAEEMRVRIHQRLQENDEEGLAPDCWIGTFHQFANRLLRIHALSLNLPPDFAILNTLSQKVLFNRVMRGILGGDFANLGPVLEKYGLASAISPDILSLASLSRIGRSLGIESLEDVFDGERLYNLIGRIKATGLSPVEFLETAQSQARQLGQALLELPLPDDPGLSKEDRLREKLLAWQTHFRLWAQDGWDPLGDFERSYIGLDKGPTPAKYAELMKPFVDFYLTKGTGKDGYSPCLPDYDSLKRLLQQENQLAEWVAAVYAVYQDSLLSQGTCDFDDLMNHAIRLLVANPAIQARYRQYFEAIIVDEFQDSNGSQLRLLDLLARETPPNLTVVGDIKQSIYGFRFAQPENMSLVFRNRPCETINLNINYRSQPPVLAVANRLTEGMLGHREHFLNPRDGVDPEASPVVWLDLDGVDENGRTLPQSVQHEKEARFIAVEIASLVESGQYQFGDIAVLVRSHRKAEAIQEVLTSYGIPALRRKNLGFFQEPVVKDAMALLRLMLNLGDDASLVRILQSRLNHRQLRILSEARQKNQSLLEVCLNVPSMNLPLPQAVVSAVTELAQSLLKIRKIQPRLSAIQLFLRLKDTIGLVRPGWDEATGAQQTQSVRTLEKLLFLLSQKNPLQPTLQEVVETLKHYEENAQAELPVSDDLGAENAVQLLTVFAAKGLEYPVVFVSYTEAERGGRLDDTLLLFDPQYEGKKGFGLMLGRFNREATLKKELFIRSWHKPRQRLEEQRVFYVALTRARERLYVVRGSKSPGWSDPMDYPASNVQCLCESRNHDILQERYWDPSQEDIRQALQAMMPTDASPPSEVQSLRDGDDSLGVQAARTANLSVLQVPVVMGLDRLNAFQTCPVRYWFQYQSRIAMSMKPPSPEQALKELIMRHYRQESNMSESAVERTLKALPDGAAEDVRRRYQAFLQSEYSYSILKSEGYLLYPEKALQFTDNDQTWQEIVDLLLYNPVKEMYTACVFKASQSVEEGMNRLRLCYRAFQKIYPTHMLNAEHLRLIDVSSEGIRTERISEAVLSSGLEQYESILEQIFRQHLELRIPEAPAAVDCTPCAYRGLCPMRKEPEPA